MKEMVQDFDLVSCCLSKGMGCPAGSMVVGSEKDINEARNLRKMLGGGMRQSGVLTACGIVALTDWQQKIEIDNANAYWIGQQIAGIKGLMIDPKLIETNIVRFTFEKSLLSKMKLDHDGFRDKLKSDKNILSGSGF